MSFSAFARCMICLLAFASQSGCTIVRVDGPANVSQVRFGVIRIVPTDQAEMVAYRSVGVGIVPGHNGATLGYAQQTVVSVGAEESCRVILFEPHPGEVEQLRAILARSIDNREICTVGEQE